MPFLAFERKLALRYLLNGRSQTLLTVSTVAMGVLVIIFISSLMQGFGVMIKDQLTDVVPHVTVRPKERLPESLDSSASSRLERQSQQRKNLAEWPRTVEAIERLSVVDAVAPVILDQAFVSRAGKRIGATIFGADPDRADRVTHISKYVYSGRYRGIGIEEAVANDKVVQELGLQLGSRVRVVSSEAVAATFVIVGLYDSGSEQDTPRLFVNLRAAQALYKTGRSVQQLLVRGKDLFQANIVAERIRTLVPDKVESWMDLQPMYATSLGVTDAVSALISGFSLIAAAAAISSVLIVAVMQKNRQIGVLKSMGAKSRQIFMVFSLQGLGIALLGGAIGGAAGVGVIELLLTIKRPADRIGAPPKELFPFLLTWQTVAVAVFAATLATLLAAGLPARRAAKLDPAEAMR